MRKKILIVSFILIVIATASIVYINFSNKKVTLEDIQNIEYDMKISIEDARQNPSIGGYANYNYYTLINTKEKKAYYIEDKYVYGNPSEGEIRGNNYTLEKVKLNKDQIDGLIQIFTNYTKEDSFVGNYVNITYNGETRSFKYKTIEKQMEDLGLKVKI